MEVLFLGTCACDYSPKLKDEFLNSFDFDARRSSCLLLDGQYLIDCGEHGLDSLRIAGVKYDAISDLFISHLHTDHFNARHIAEIAKGKAKKLRVWVREDAKTPDIENVEFIKMSIGERYEVSSGFAVMGLRANHDEKAAPQHLLFEKDGKKFLYACDGAWFLNETWYRMKGLELDLLVLDATCGDYAGDYRIGEHNTIPMIRLMQSSLQTWKTVNAHTKIYLSHIAPSLHKPHKETEKLIEADGLKLAYDGLRVKV